MSSCTYLKRSDHTVSMIKQTTLYKEGEHADERLNICMYIREVSGFNCEQRRQLLLFTNEAVVLNCS